MTVTWLYNSILVDECEGLDLLQTTGFAENTLILRRLLCRSQFCRRRITSICAESGQERGKSL